jgi:hypothetical protein
VNARTAERREELARDRGELALLAQRARSGEESRLRDDREEAAVLGRLVSAELLPLELEVDLAPVEARERRERLGLGLEPPVERLLRARDDERVDRHPDERQHEQEERERRERDPRLDRPHERPTHHSLSGSSRR